MRLFIGVPVEAEARDILGGQVTELRQRIGGPLSWVPSANFHITLKFLGQVKEDKIPGILETLQNTHAAVAAFRVIYAGLGAFGGRKARVLWVGVSAGAEQVRALAMTCENAMAKLGFSSEEREFHPHLTIAKSRSAIALSAELLRAESGSFSGVAQQIDRIALFESIPMENGVRYVELGSIPLLRSGA